MENQYKQNTLRHWFTVFMVSVFFPVFLDEEGLWKSLQLHKVRK